MRKKASKLVELIEDMQIIVSNDDERMHHVLSLARKLAIEIMDEAKANERKKRMLKNLMRSIFDYTT